MQGKVSWETPLAQSATGAVTAAGNDATDIHAVPPPNDTPKDEGKAESSEREHRRQSCVLVYTGEVGQGQGAVMTSDHLGQYIVPYAKECPWLSCRDLGAGYCA